MFIAPSDLYHSMRYHNPESLLPPSQIVSYLIWFMCSGARPYVAITKFGENCTYCLLLPTSILALIGEAHQQTMDQS